MKRLNYKLLVPGGLATMVFIFACNKSFLNQQPYGVYDAGTLANRAGVEGLLIGAYSLLDGNGGAGTDVSGAGTWVTAQDNWVWGGVAGGDAHKGSDPGDQPEIPALEKWSENPGNGWLGGKWRWGYDAIQRSNDVLRVMRGAGDMTSADTTEAGAEARFLRAYYSMDLKKIFNQICIVDESISYSAGNFDVPNNVDAWPFIESDLQYAVANLPATQSEIGRANKYAAEALLAKAYMFEHKYSQAQSLLTDLINNGQTAGGLKYGLLPHFNDNFNAETKNESESVFACQMSVNDNTGAANANDGDVLNYPYNNGDVPFVNCCGFYQPSYSLVNSFRTDPTTGLPDPVNYNNVDMRNDEGLAKADPFTPYAAPGTVGEAVDPRLDWTSGRRGIPYLDWGVDPGVTWVRNQASAGPYVPIKNAPYARQNGVLTDKSSWTAGYSANNYNIIRFADIVLWAAEVEVEIGSLDQAETYVNMVRGRMEDNHGGWVHQYLDNSNPQGGFYTDDAHLAANYVIHRYPSGYFSSKGQATSRTLVQFERKLELGMEGHRLFDLVRWGIADVELNAYATHEISVSGYTYLSGAHFVKGKNEYYPIPQAEIDKSGAVLVQNPGY